MTCCWSLIPTDYQLNLKQAEANLASSQARLSQAKAKLKRAQTLGDNQYISADELLERETDVMVFQAQIQAKKWRFQLPAETWKNAA